MGHSGFTVLPVARSQTFQPDPGHSNLPPPLRRMKYSDKKRRFTSNTNVYTNRDGVITGISESTVGSLGDTTLLRERPMPFGRWEEAMHGQDRPEGEKNRVFCDRGYQGISSDLPSIVPMIPRKRTKKSPLTREQGRHNSRINSERVLVEHRH